MGVRGAPRKQTCMLGQFFLQIKWLSLYNLCIYLVKISIYKSSCKVFPSKVLTKFEKFAGAHYRVQPCAGILVYVYLEKFPSQQPAATIPGNQWRQILAQISGNGPIPTLPASIPPLPEQPGNGNTNPAQVLDKQGFSLTPRMCNSYLQIKTMWRSILEEGITMPRFIVTLDSIYICLSHSLNCFG